MMQIIDLLQSIQDNLVGIVLPVLITAFVSVISILANAVMQIILRNSNINGEQYKLMQIFYPKMKISLLELKFGMKEIQSNPIYTDMQCATRKYVEYKKDSANYVKKNENEIQNIDQFITAMEKYLSKITPIKEHLNNCTIPRPPVMHPIIKRKVSKMLAVLWYYSLLWDEYNIQHINGNIFQQEIKNLKKKWNVELTCEKIEEYICLLDKWLLKY
ncbi:MAG: hypothetical protein NC305_04745 [Lachnospiraceae bacterium]|nr:hypothetical protein [Muribaculum sp.]MCM1409840.1 hypothetical protein [Lachnospiraceae bacterium]